MEKFTTKVSPYCVFFYGEKTKVQFVSI